MHTHDDSHPLATEGACRATGEAMGQNGAKPGRFSAQRKTEIVLRLLRGDDLDFLSRELRVPAARLATWRDAFLASGQEALKKQPCDARDRAIARLREKLGEATMANELLQEKIARLETGRPLWRRRSSR
jgi:hypothetical protein